LRLSKYSPTIGLKPISIFILGLLAVVALLILASGEVRGDPPAQGDWYIEGNESYADTTFTIHGNLQINQTSTLSLDNVTLIFNNTKDQEFSMNIFGTVYLNSSTIKSVNSSYRMGDTDISGNMESRGSLIRDFADFRLESGADFFANDTVFSNGRRLFVTQDDLGTVVLENSTIDGTGNPSNIIINDDVFFKDVDFPADEVSLGQNGKLVVQYYLSVFVNDTIGKIMDGAGIHIESFFTDLNFFTDSTGWSRTMPLTRYTKTSSKTTYDENFTVTVSKTGYFDSEVDVQMDKTRSISVTLTPLPDPYVEENDITIPLKPNEGDYMGINVSIHNKGEDASIRINIYLEDSKGGRTLLKQTGTMILKDGIISYVEANWNTTQKKVGSYKIVVVIDNRTADRNITNNTAEKSFTLHARPIVTAITTNVTDVYRISSVSIGVVGEDIETSPENLTLKIQAHPSSGGLWDSSYFSPPYWNGSAWLSNFTPDKNAKLGNYDFRFRFTDENNGASDWYFRQKYIFVMNNQPVITQTIPDVEIDEDTNLVLDLTGYEDDREDGAAPLIWWIEHFNPDAILSINGQNSTDDVLTFIPQTNWTGNTSVHIVLSDKDGGMDSQYFHIHWRSVNDVPILDNVSFSVMQVLRTFPMVLTINATDDNTTVENLKLAFQLQLEGDVGWTDVNFNIVTQFIDDVDQYWRVTITPSSDAGVGNYTLRFNITDDHASDTGRSHYYYYAVIVLNNPPEILDITPASPVVLRTDTLVFTFNGTDVEDAEEDLQPVVEFKYKKYAFNTLVGAWYDAASNAWSFNFTPSTGSGIGNYTFRAMFIDTDGGESDWMETLIVVVNNPPVVLNLTVSANVLAVNHTFYVYANGTDVEDLESKLVPTLELMSVDGAGIWFTDYVTDASFVGDTWVFTIHLPENATLENYSFRLSFVDLDGDISVYLTETDALYVINNVPIPLNMGIPTEVSRTRGSILYANADCDLDDEEELDVEFGYYHQGQWWDPDTPGSFLDEAVYHFLRWEIEFTPDELDATLGNYSFRVRFKLNESSWSSWLYLQNGTEVVNSIPEVRALEFNSTMVYRGNQLTVNITIHDAEDDVDQLNPTLQYSPDGINWDTTYLSAITLDDGIYTSTFSPPFTAAIGNYTFRAMGSDTEGDDSLWYLNLTTVWVRNNAPVIVSGAIPAAEDNEDNPLAIRLTQYESDKEDDHIDLDWQVTDYDPQVITKINHNPNYDVFTFTPAENFTGTTLVWFKLLDSDGDSAVVNTTLTWISVNDEPIIEQTWTNQTSIMRDGVLTVYIQACDDDNQNADLTPVIHYSLDGESWFNASVTSVIVGDPDNGLMIVNHTIPTTVLPGNYTIRVKVMDTSGHNRTENSTWHCLPGTVEFVNHLPEILDIQLLDNIILRTQEIPVYVDASDLEDDLQNMSLELAYSYDYKETTGVGNWTVGYSGSVYYDDIFEYLVIEFIPVKDAPLGKIFLRARVIDRDGGRSHNWSEVANLTVLNNGPGISTIPAFDINEDTVLVVNLTAYGSDIENDASELRWFVDDYNATIITLIEGNGTTEIRFTPLENFTGMTVVTLNLTDLDGAFVTTTISLEWTIVYEAPRIIRYLLAENFVYRETTLVIDVEVHDDDDPNGTLIGTLEYLPPGAGDWVDLPISFANDMWTSLFTPGSDWITGVYTFRVKFQDSDELESPWSWTNITVLSTPMVESFDGPDIAYRTHTVVLYVNGSDANDDEEWELTPHFGYSRSNITYSSGAFDTPYFTNGMFIVNFTPPAGLVIDQYFVRVRFNDTDGAYSTWAYIMVDIRNNEPEFTGTVPDSIETEDVAVSLDLEAYGSDDENPSDELNWTADWTHGIQEVTGNNTRDLTIIPVLDFNGDAEVMLTIHDKDGATASQSITLTWNPVNDGPRISVLELESDTTDLLGRYIYHTGSNLTAVLHDLIDPEGDLFTVHYSWIVNGNIIVENSTTATNFTSDNFERGDVVTLRVILSDGTESRWFENTTLISNAPPSIQGVTIVVLYLGEETGRANESCIIRVNPYGYSDLDGEPADYANFRYEWYSKADLIASGLDLDEINGTAFGKDFDVYCRVLPFDGKDYGFGERSSTVRIFNTPPTIQDITVDYNGGEPFGPNEYSILSLNLSGYQDVDDDVADYDTFMYSWFVNGFEIGVTTSALGSEYFAKGDNVYCRVTPYDGTEFGNAADSDSIVIQNTPPTIIDVSLDFTGSRPDKHSTLSIDMSGFEDPDGDLPDLDSFAYDWYVDGNSVGAGATLDLAAYDRDDDVYCIVTPSDGINFGIALTSDTITILNTPPSLTGASIQITYDGNVVVVANLSSVLTANGENYFDEDSDPSQESRYSWYINDTFAKSGSSIDGSYFSKGERVYCLVEPYDGTYYGDAVKTEEIFIDNTAPEVGGVQVTTWGRPTRVAIIIAEAIDYFDEDNDPQGAHGYVWYVNGVPVPGQFDPTLKNTINNTYFTKGDVITVQLTPYDGMDYGIAVQSSNNVTIINTAPVLEQAEMEWTGDLNATTTLSVNAKQFYSDPDGDLFSHFYYQWFVNSDLVITTFDINTLTGQFISRDRVYCRVIPNDGEDNGSAVFTPSVLVLDSPPEIYGNAIVYSETSPTNEYSTIRVNTDSLTTMDIDDDRTSYVFIWYVNGIPAGAPEENGFTGIYFDEGDRVSCRILSFDGILRSDSFVDSTEIVIENTAPVAIISRPFDNSQADVQELIRLDGSASFDPDDSDNPQLSYRWLVDDVEVATSKVADVYMSPGDHEITLEVSDESAFDTAIAAVHIRASDLLVTEERIIFSGTQYVGKTISFVVDIGNIGDGDAEGVSISFLVDDILVGSITDISIGSNNNETVALSWKATKGTHIVKVIMDREEESEEIDEDNNVAQRDLEITTKADSEELIFGMKEQYLWIIVILIVATAVLSLGDIIRWRRGDETAGKKDSSKSGK